MIDVTLEQKYVKYRYFNECRYRPVVVRCLPTVILIAREPFYATPQTLIVLTLLILDCVISINIVARPKKEDSCDVFFFHFLLCERLTLSPLELFIAKLGTIRIKVV